MRKLIRRILIRLLQLLSESFYIIESNDKMFSIVRQEIERYYNIPYEQLISGTRKRPICEKRQLLQVLALKHTKLSTVAIGRLTNRDHATVIHARKTINNLLSTGDRIAGDYYILDEKIKQRIVKVT